MCNRMAACTAATATIMHGGKQTKAQRNWIIIGIDCHLCSRRIWLLFCSVNHGTSDPEPIVFLHRTLTFLFILIFIYIGLIFTSTSINIPASLMLMKSEKKKTFRLVKMNGETFPVICWNVESWRPY